MTKRRLFDYHHPMDDPDYDEDLYVPFVNGNQIELALRERIRFTNYHESIAAHFFKEFSGQYEGQLTHEYVSGLFLSHLEEFKQSSKYNVLIDFVENSPNEINLEDIRVRAEAVLQNLAKENGSLG